MTAEISAALIALTGVVFSVLISLFTSQRQATLEVNKLRREVHQDFSLRLFEKRLESYPNLYEYLSSFKKKIQYEQVTQGGMLTFFDSLQRWDSQNSILLGSETGKLLYHFRKDVFSLTRKSDQEIQLFFNTSESIHSFTKKITQLELSLKSELGIYIYDSPAEIRDAKKFRSYQEVTEFSQKYTQSRSPKS